MGKKKRKQPIMPPTPGGMMPRGMPAQQSGVQGVPPNMSLDQAITTLISNERAGLTAAVMSSYDQVTQQRNSVVNGLIQKIRMLEEEIRILKTEQTPKKAPPPTKSINNKHTTKA